MHSLGATLPISDMCTKLVDMVYFCRRMAYVSRCSYFFSRAPSRSLMSANESCARITGWTDAARSSGGSRVLETRRRACFRWIPRAQAQADLKHAVVAELYSPCVEGVKEI